MNTVVKVKKRERVCVVKCSIEYYNENEENGIELTTWCPLSHALLERIEIKDIESILSWRLRKNIRLIDLFKYQNEEANDIILHQYHSLFKWLISGSFTWNDEHTYLIIINYSDDLRQTHRCISHVQSQEMKVIFFTLWFLVVKITDECQLGEKKYVT